MYDILIPFPILWGLYTPLIRGDCKNRPISNQLDISDSNTVRSHRGGGENLIVQPNVQNGGPGRPNGGTVIGSLSIGKGDGTEVSKGNKGVVLLEILNNSDATLLSPYFLFSRDTFFFPLCLYIGVIYQLFIPDMRHLRSTKAVQQTEASSLSQTPH